jgi:membrane peptidoglycan carboxypeptidase
LASYDVPSLIDGTSRPRIAAVLVDSKSAIVGFYSTSPELYFSRTPLPIASTSKIFAALALGQYDMADSNYCVPSTSTGWWAIDAQAISCVGGPKYVKARTAFARSMSVTILSRMLQNTTEYEVGQVLLKCGLVPPQTGSARASTALGKLAATPRELHRAVHAITLSFAHRGEAALLPTLIVSRQGVQISSLNAGAINACKELMTPSVETYTRAVLSETITRGTLRHLVIFRTQAPEIEFMWGKTGTYAEGGTSRYIWLVGGMILHRKAYSWLVLVAASDESQISVT